MPTIIATRLDYNPRVTGFDKNAQPDPASDHVSEGVTATTTIFWEPWETDFKYTIDYYFWEWDNDVEGDDDDVRYGQSKRLEGPHDQIEPVVMQIPRVESWDDEIGGDEIYAKVFLRPEPGQFVLVEGTDGDFGRRRHAVKTEAYTNRVDRWW